MYGSIIPLGVRRSAPLMDADGVGGGSAQATAQPESAQAQTETVDATSQSQNNGIGPLRFSDLKIEDNPIWKALNGENSSAPEGQANQPTATSGTDRKPADTTATQTDASSTTPDPFKAVIEEIAKINPKAAEKYTSPEAIAKTIVNQEKTLTSLFTERAQLTRMLDNLKTELERLRNQQELQAQQQVQQQAQQQPQLTEEQLRELNEKELAEMMDNPLQYKQKLIDEATKIAMQKLMEEVDRKYGPVAQTVTNQQTIETVTKILEDFRNATDENGNLLHPDFDIYSQEMGEVLNQYPELKENTEKLPLALEFAYNVVKGKHSTGAIDPAKLLEDQEFLNNYVLKNDSIRQAIIQEYVKSIQQGQPPVLIAGQPGGAPPASPPEKPKTFREATAAAAKFFGW